MKLEPWQYPNPPASIENEAAQRFVLELCRAVHYCPLSKRFGKFHDATLEIISELCDLLTMEKPQ